MDQLHDDNLEAKTDRELLLLTAQRQNLLVIEFNKWTSSIDRRVEIVETWRTAIVGGVIALATWFKISGGRPHP